MTIFALSSGHPPAGIAVVRISGPQAGQALAQMAGELPEPRRASYRRFRDEHGAPLDDGLALWFPGPASATGEDVAELHLHGGRAVVAAVLARLGRMEGLRPAKPGEFTRRAFENGRIDLAEAEGLADLLAAETELQRQAALALAEGAVGVSVSRWQQAILQASAKIEAELDFADEDDVAAARTSDVADLVNSIAGEMATLLAAPPAERLRDGISVVLAGPPNVGKSSLFNALAGRHAAIVSHVAGTTRDRIEAPVAIDGIAFLLIDTAGLRETPSDTIETAGIILASEAIERADIVLWLGSAAEMPPGATLIASKADLGGTGEGLRVSTLTDEGTAQLRVELIRQAHKLLPKPGQLALNLRHRSIVEDVLVELTDAAGSIDLLIIAEHLRRARVRLNDLTGRAGTEQMLDALFGGFCIGK